MPNTMTINYKSGGRLRTKRRCRNERSSSGGGKLSALRETEIQAGIEAGGRLRPNCKTRMWAAEGTAHSDMCRSKI